MFLNQQINLNQAIKNSNGPSGYWLHSAAVGPVPLAAPKLHLPCSPDLAARRRRAEGRGASRLRRRPAEVFVGISVVKMTHLSLNLTLELLNLSLHLFWKLFRNRQVLEWFIALVFFQPYHGQWTASLGISALRWTRFHVAPRSNPIGNEHKSPQF